MIWRNVQNIGMIYTLILKAPKLHDEDVNVPSKWMLFGLEIQHHTDEEDILQESVCNKVAQSCYIDEEDFKLVLAYFTDIGLHICYPKVVPNLIFTGVTPIVERLNNIISASFCKPVCGGPMGEDRNQLKVGKLTRTLLDNLWQQKQSIFTVDNFLALLEHLHIAVKIDKSTYFLPCVLHLDDPTNQLNSEPHFRNNCDPIILLTEKGNTLPQGFFPALVVDMLQRESSPTFQLSDGIQLRRLIRLFSNNCAICLVDQITWFEVYLSGKVEYCPVVLKKVKECAKHISEILNIDFQLMRGFYCPGNCGIVHPHPCILKDDTAICSQNRTCFCNLEDFSSERMQCWMKSPEGMQVFFFTFIKSSVFI